MKNSHKDIVDVFKAHQNKVRYTRPSGAIFVLKLGTGTFKLSRVVEKCEL